VLKWGLHWIENHLTLIFNALLEKEIYPEEWNESLITPVYKKEGGLGDPNNYREVSLLSFLGKVYSVILNKRLNTWAEGNGLISYWQAGLKKFF